MATRLLRIWRTSKARFWGSSAGRGWSKGTTVDTVAVGMGNGGGGVVNLVFWADMLEASDSTDRSQLDFMFFFFFSVSVCDIWVVI